MCDQGCDRKRKAVCKNVEKLPFHAAGRGICEAEGKDQGEETGTQKREKGDLTHCKFWSRIMGGLGVIVEYRKE